MNSTEPRWLHLLASYPFAAALLSSWRVGSAELPESYKTALEAALLAFDRERPLDERYQNLIDSRESLAKLAADGDVHVATQQLRIRVHLAFGETKTGRRLAETLLQTLEAGQTPPLDRPFLPAIECFDERPPANDSGDWLLALALDTVSQLNACGHHSVSAQHLSRIAERRKLPYSRIENERRLALAALRAGKKVTLKEGGRLVMENLNQNIWTGLGQVGATSSWQIRDQTNATTSREGSVLSAGDKGKIVHICFNNTHVSTLIKMLEIPYVQAGFEHTVYIEKSRSISGYDVDINNLSRVFYFSASLQEEQLVSNILENNVLAVFFHGIFFDWQKRILRKVSVCRNIVWVVWGGDLYMPIKLNSPVNEIKKHVNWFASCCDKDLDLAEKYYGKKLRANFFYNFEFESYSSISNKENLVFIGNSGDPSNNHVEIIEMLSMKVDKNNYLYIAPMAYNAPHNYVKIVSNTAKKAGLKLEIIEKIMPKELYYEKLQKAKLVIMAHDRQQGFGNVASALYFKAIVCLKRKIFFKGLILNPLWSMLSDQPEIRLCSYEDLTSANSLDEILDLFSRYTRSNSHKVIASFGNDNLMRVMRNTFLEVGSHV